MSTHQGFSCVRRFCTRAIEVFFVFLVMGGCATITKERIDEETLSPAKNSRLTLPMTVDLLVYIPTGINGVQRTYGGVKVGVEEKLDEMVISAARKYFKNADHYGKDKPAHLALLVKGHALLHPGTYSGIAVTAYVEGAFYNPKGKLVYEGRSQATEEILNRDEETLLNALHNTHAKAAMKLFEELVADRVKELTLLASENLTGSFDLPKINSKFEIEKFSSGSGILVSPKGHIVTSQHVVNNCVTIAVSMNGTEEEAKVVAVDVKNDIALLSSNLLSERFARFLDKTSEARLGEEIVTLGYPLTGVLSSEPSLSVGNVSALAGIRDDKGVYQFTAPVQPGSSGGPLLTKSGALRGMVKGKLNALLVADKVGDIPQNVNFAVKEHVLLNFLKSQNVPLQADISDAQSLETPDLAEAATKFTTKLTCSGIKAENLVIHVNEYADR